MSEKLKSRKNQIVKIISFGVLTPFFLWPLSFCPFKFPYIYCLVCPVRCQWGKVRGFLLLGTLTLNLRRNFYCAHFCPGGTTQDLEYRVKSKKIAISKKMKALKYLVLFLVVAAVWGIRSFSSLIIVREALFVLLVSALLLAFFDHRFWCKVFCPIKTVSEMISKMKSVFRRVK